MFSIQLQQKIGNLISKRNRYAIIINFFMQILNILLLFTLMVQLKVRKVPIQLGRVCILLSFHSRCICSCGLHSEIFLDATLLYTPRLECKLNANSNHDRWNKNSPYSNEKICTSSSYYCALAVLHLRCPQATHRTVLLIKESVATRALRCRLYSPFGSSLY